MAIITVVPAADEKSSLATDIVLNSLFHLTHILALASVLIVAYAGTRIATTPFMSALT